MKQNPLAPPTQVNVITGFLGSGKTTLLQCLLAQKPPDEKWAVLVNEFGQVGVDAALMNHLQVKVQEIPGGCLCCVNSLSFQVGLNRLLREVKPDRILIEPSGIGHPAQILAMLRSPTYQRWLSLKATLCLLDARHLSQSRYVSHEIFLQQLEIADIIIANKRDDYRVEDWAALQAWCLAQGNARVLVETQFGQVDISLLDKHHQVMADDLNPVAKHTDHPIPSISPMAKTPAQLGHWYRAFNRLNGFISCGWVFPAETIFCDLLIIEWINSVKSDRLKAVLRTSQGALRINRAGHDLTILVDSVQPEVSRIELIHQQELDWNHYQTLLLKARILAGMAGKTSV